MPDLPRPKRVIPKPLARVADLVGRPSATLADRRITGVTHDSRRVLPGDLYAALPGARAHGADFVAVAAQAGAAAVITDPAGVDQVRRRVGDRLPALVVNDPRGILGTVAAYVYDQPARDLIMLGVTGTNGKTTTAHLVECGFLRSGQRTGLIGTVETSVGDERFPSVRTTPEATDVHALLAVMRERGCSACVMEVSSHALALGRVGGIVFDVAGFTNLSQDHLDFHADMEDYFSAKAALFTEQHARRGVVLVDDEYGRRLAAGSTIPVETVSVGRNDADWRVVATAIDAGNEAGSVTLEHRGDGGRIEVVPPVPGEFNVANAALAVVMLMSVGVPPGNAIQGIASCPGVPGRMERVHSTGVDQPLAVVDYAHTPDAVENVLAALRPSRAGRLVVVLGCGGDRDPHKRTAMGVAAARNADLVIVTDDNPRWEDPARIRAAVVAGALAVPPDERGAVEELADRRAAIQRAVAAACGDADTVVVVGKGHEQGQEVAGVLYPFDDRIVLREALLHARDRRARSSS